MSIPEYADEDAILWLSDVADPRRYAEGLLVVHKDIARELLAARKTPQGFKLRRDPDLSLARQMRGAGLCSEEVASWYLSNFGKVVRNHLLQIINTRVMEHPLENDTPEAAE